MGEFALIQSVFAQRAASLLAAQPSHLIGLGIGDDCALINALGAHEQLAVSTDMFVAGTHFFHDTAAADIGYKALAVNLSDLAAMGATPIGFTLALSTPTADEPFLHGVADGLFELASQARCPLIGGDTTRGPLNIAITVFGRVAKSQVLRRDAAKEGQIVWVSGALGAAALAVQMHYNQQVPPPACLASLLRPQPRLTLGAGLAQQSSCAMDLSDGLYGDLQHIASASKVDIQINLDSVPLADSLTTLARDYALKLALTGGDDYELVFTAAPNNTAAIAQLGAQLGIPLTPIGRVTAAGDQPQVICLGPSGVPLPTLWHQQLKSYEHF